MRRFLPREHGLIAWVGLPLLAALACAPGWRTAAAVGTVLAGFGGFNAARRGDTRGVGLCAALALPLGVVAVLGAAAPGALALVLGIGAATALGMAMGFRQLPRAVGIEALAIGALGGLGVAVAVAGGGAEPGPTLTVGLVLASWQIAGLWWVRRSLAGLLPGRRPWDAGLLVALGVAATALAAGCLYGLLAVPAVLVLYPLRVLVHGRPRSARQVGRVGLTELGWSVLALAAAVAASGTMTS